jgi:hypothetical protein
VEPCGWQPVQLAGAGAQAAGSAAGGGDRRASGIFAKPLVADPPAHTAAATADPFAVAAAAAPPAVEGRERYADLEAWLAAELAPPPPISAQLATAPKEARLNRKRSEARRGVALRAHWEVVRRVLGAGRAAAAGEDAAAAAGGQEEQQGGDKQQQERQLLTWAAADGSGAGDGAPDACVWQFPPTAAAGSASRGGKGGSSSTAAPAALEALGALPGPATLSELWHAAQMARILDAPLSDEDEDKDDDEGDEENDGADGGGPAQPKRRRNSLAPDEPHAGGLPPPPQDTLERRLGNLARISERARASSLEPADGEAAAGKQKELERGRGRFAALKQSGQSRRTSKKGAATGGGGVAAGEDAEQEEQVANGEPQQPQEQQQQQQQPPPPGAARGPPKLNPRAVARVLRKQLANPHRRLAVELLSAEGEDGDPAAVESEMQQLLIDLDPTQQQQHHHHQQQQHSRLQAHSLGLSCATLGPSSPAPRGLHYEVSAVGLGVAAGSHERGGRPLLGAVRRSVIGRGAGGTPTSPAGPVLESQEVHMSGGGGGTGAGDTAADAAARRQLPPRCALSGLVLYTPSHIHGLLDVRPAAAQPPRPRDPAAAGPSSVLRSPAAGSVGAPAAPPPALAGFMSQEASRKWLQLESDWVVPTAWRDAAQLRGAGAVVPAATAAAGLQRAGSSGQMGPPPQAIRTQQQQPQAQARVQPRPASQGRQPSVRFDEPGRMAPPASRSPQAQRAGSSGGRGGGGGGALASPQQQQQQQQPPPPPAAVAPIAAPTAQPPPDSGQRPLPSSKTKKKRTRKVAVEGFM